MTKTADQVRGIRTEQRVPFRQEVPHDPENGKISREAFLAKRAKYKLAQAAAQKAWDDSIGEAKVEERKILKPVKPVEPQKASEDLVALRQQYAEICVKLEADPTSRSLKIQKTKLMNRIEAEEEKE
jgi:hypothetical protein